MAVYTFHPPKNAMLGDRAVLEKAVLVRDGFSWWALIFQPFWCLWHRLWLLAAGVFLLNFALSAGLEWAGLPENMGVAASFLFSLWFGFEANNLRRFFLEARGMRMQGVVIARNEQEAERRAFAIWLEEKVPSEVLSATDSQDFPLPSTRPMSYSQSTNNAGIIGLFPAVDERL